MAQKAAEAQEAQESSLQLEVRDLEPIRVAAKRLIGPYEGLGDTLLEVKAWAEAHQIPINAGDVISVTHDNPVWTRASKLRSDACVRLPDGVEVGENEEGIVETSVAGGQHYTVIHRGNPSKLPDTYKYLIHTAIRQGNTVGGAPYQVYLNAGEVADEDDLQVEINLPVKPMGACAIQ
eukprot:scaffold672_cov268-Pinguiococcus_pyrenoidosus.AAC.7